MKIYVTHSNSFDFKNELYKPIRESDLNSINEIALPHETSTEQFNSREYMKDCGLIIAEVSYPSTGQGIELGWANLYGVPIICIYKEGIKPSGALKVVSNNFIEYTNINHALNKIQSQLR